MSSKDIVLKFYNSDLANDETVISNFFHKECELHWNSSQGYMNLNYSDVVSFFEGTRKAYESLRFEFSHILEDGEFVTSRHTLYANTIENPEEEVALAHFISIWQIMDGKLYRCHEISQLADESTMNTDSFKQIKI